MKDFVAPYIELTKKDTSRIAWLDTAKAIGIILVIIYHLDPPMPGHIKVMITSFFLPIFFFVSGMFFRPMPWKKFLKKKFQTIVLPLIFFYWMSCLLIAVRQTLGAQFETPIRFANFFDIFRPDEYLYTNVALWFLVALFNVNIIVNIIEPNYYKWRWGG